MPSMNMAIHSIILEQYAQINSLLLSLNEFTLFQVNVHLLLNLLLVWLCISLVD